MAEAKQRAEWDRMSLLCALTANCHSVKKEFTTDDFSPYARAKNASKNKSAAIAAIQRIAKTAKKITLPVKGS
jgi:hypothetical protein